MATRYLRMLSFDRTVLAVSDAHFLSHLYLLALPPLFPLLKSEFAVSDTELGRLMSAMAISICALQAPVDALVD